MSTEFQKLSGPKPEKGSFRNFQISFRITETRQHYEISEEFKVKELYDDRTAFKERMFDGFNKLLEAYLRSLPI